MSFAPKKCVVVPVDFSPASDVAIQTALSLVESAEHVRVIHVVSVPDYIPYGEFVWVVEPHDWEEKAALHLAQYIKNHPEFQNVIFATLKGDPAAEIVKYANTHHADLIVMPCHGRRGIRRLLLGSVTHEVLNHAQCEVLVQRYPE